MIDNNIFWAVDNTFWFVVADDDKVYELNYVYVDNKKQDEERNF